MSPAWAGGSWAPSAAAQDWSPPFPWSSALGAGRLLSGFPHWLPPFVAITEAGAPLINLSLAPILFSLWVKISSFAELLACEPSVHLVSKPPPGFPIYSEAEVPGVHHSWCFGLLAKTEAGSRKWQAGSGSRKQLFVLLQVSFLWGPGNFSLLRGKERSNAENPALGVNL